MKALADTNRWLPIDADVAVKMQEKCPNVPDVLPPKEEDPPRARMGRKITLELLSKTLRKTRRGRSADELGVRYDHLKDIVCAGHEELVLFMVNSFTCAELAEDLRKLAAGARAAALLKPDESVRTIWIGLALRRLAAACLVAGNDSEARKFFGHLQLAIGLSAGVEVVPMLVRMLLHPDDQVLRHGLMALLEVDVANAYNEVRRTAVLHVLRQFFPDWVPFFRLCYDSVVEARYRDCNTGLVGRLFLSTGLLQGACDSSFLFALVLQGVLQKLEGMIRPQKMFLSAFADNIFLYVRVPLAASVLQELNRLLQEQGLRLKTEKLLFPLNCTGAQAQEALRDRAGPNLFTITEDHKILGVRIAHKIQDEQEALRDKLHKIEDLSSLILKHMPHQLCTSLLRYCFLSKTNFLLRTTVPQVATDELAGFDNRMQRAWMEWMDLPQDGRVRRLAWEMALLPVRMHGAGFWSTLTLRLCCFLAPGVQHHGSSAVGRRVGGGSRGHARSRGSFLALRSYLRTGVHCTDTHAPAACRSGARRRRLRSARRHRRRRSPPAQFQHHHSTSVGRAGSRAALRLDLAEWGRHASCSAPDGFFAGCQRRHVCDSLRSRPLHLQSSLQDSPQAPFGHPSDQRTWLVQRPTLGGPLQLQRSSAGQRQGWGIDPPP
jgi:hypothetical protein